MSSKTKRKYTKKPKTDVAFWLEKISSQLERLILCHEKQLGGQVLSNFNSQAELESREDS